jgi:lipopolysaccharide/colanic/teichoic acid biosynthesis glycosyltransferase
VAYRSLQHGLKRTMDIVMAGALLVLLVPLMLLAAVAIKLDSPGPVSYNRRRVGKDGRPFVMYKLRTMTANAEQRLADLQHLNRGGPHMIKIANDPRVTRVGRLLRATSIDELPQLLNVLKGEMSLVGPRPQTPDEVALYTEEHRLRLTVKPGMTGLWQVRDRHNASFERWMAWDLAYVRGWSLWLDLSIACQTIALIVVDSWSAVF